MTIRIRSHKSKTTANTNLGKNRNRRQSMTHKGIPDVSCHIDPVCEMNVKETEHTCSYHKNTYYFCSYICKDTFVNNPQKYLPRQSEE